MPSLPALSRQCLVLSGYQPLWFSAALAPCHSGVIYLHHLLYYFTNNAHICSPFLGGYGARTRGVYQHLPLNGILKSQTKTIIYRRLSMPCVILPRCRHYRCCPPLCDNAGSADAAIYVMRSSRLIRQFGSCGLRDHAGSADAATYVMHFGNLGHAVFVTMPAQPMRLSSPCGLCCHAVCVAMRSL